MFKMLLLISLLSIIIPRGIATNCVFGEETGTDHKTERCYNVTFPITLTDQVPCENAPLILLISSSENSTIPLAAFQNFVKCQVEILYLRNLNIKEILPGAFDHLIHLKEVHLSGNELTEFTSRAFNNSDQINLLDLSRNTINKIDFETGMPGLKTLNLNSNQLIDSANFSGLFQNLEVLDLGINLIENFNICQFENLQVVNISHNKIKYAKGCLNIQNSNVSLNDSINNTNVSEQNESLTHLDMSFNEIVEIESGFLRTFTKLKSLKLQFNNISTLPEDMFINNNLLTYLDLSHNKLHQLSNDIFQNLQNLKYLNISYNNLKTVDKYLYSLKNLQQLNIEFNQISSFNTEQLNFNLTSLKFIFIHKSNFSCNLSDILNKSSLQIIFVPLENGNQTASGIQDIDCNQKKSVKNVTLEISRKFVKQNGTLDLIKQMQKVKNGTLKRQNSVNKDGSSSAVVVNKDFYSCFLLYLIIVLTIVISFN